MNPHLLYAQRGLKYKVFDSFVRPYNLNIIGIRSKYYVPNKFNDRLLVYYRNSLDWVAQMWPITTYPGVPYLRNPLNPKGAAILAPMQHIDAYELGTYKGYTALKQIRPVTVYRDWNRDSQIDLNPATMEWGLFGIHIHKAGFWSKLVGLSSAGCQVFQKSQDFEEFIQLCKRGAEEWGNSFTYTLIED